MNREGFSRTTSALATRLSTMTQACSLRAAHVSARECVSESDREIVDEGRYMEEMYRTDAQACAVHGTERRVVRWVSLVEVCVLGNAVSQSGKVEGVARGGARG